jgi:putative hemolysin
VAFVGVTALISYVSLVLGELVPKRLGLQRSEGIALAVASPLDRLATLFRPVIWLLSVTGDALVRLLGGDPDANRETISGEELRDLVAAHESLGRDERALIDDVFSAGDRQVREVMLPRTEVEFLDGAMTVGRAARIAGSSPHSRYPVVGESTDDVVGFIHLRDLLVRPDGDRSTTVGEVAREVKRLPGTKRVLAALSEMRREGHHMAIVVDEYGGTDGIVTLEDLIEEVIGEIHDEYDTPPAPGGARSDELDGLCNLDEVRESTGLELPDGPYETLAGFVMADLGTLPTVGAEVEVEGWRLTVTELDGRRASRVRVIPPAPAVTGAPVPVEP